MTVDSEFVLGEIPYDDVVPENAPGLICIMNSDLEFQYGNKSFLEFTGFKDNAELKGKTAYDMPWKNYAKRSRKLIRLFIESPDNQYLHHRRWRSADDGTIYETHTIITKFNPNHPTFAGCIIGTILVTAKIDTYSSEGQHSYIDPDGCINVGVDDHTFRVTKRESDVLASICLGGTIKATAKELGMSPSTVEFHLGNLRKKFNATSKSDLIYKAVISGAIGIMLSTSDYFETVAWTQ